MIPLPPEQEAVAQRVADRVMELIGQQIRPPCAIMTRTEAKAYVRRSSEGAFVAWCKRWKVKPHSRGRYARAQLDRALERETGVVRTPATLRRHQAELDGRAA